MTVNEYLSKQEPGRKELLVSLHEMILKTNKKVKAQVGKMMGTDMIQYKMNNHFVYGLASPKNYISLHALPMYMHKPIHEKYSKLIKGAKFQKGCINFSVGTPLGKNAEEIPLAMVEKFLMDCAKIDMEKVMEKYRKK